MKIEKIKDRINELIAFADSVIASEKHSKHGGSNGVDTELFYQLRTSSLSFLSNTFGKNHPFYIEFNEKIIDSWAYHSKQARGILKSAKQEIEGGWIFTVKGLVSAEIFSDFLEMSYYLLNEGYKDPAAVMIGSVLEEHLRQLCQTKSIPIVRTKDGKQIPKKADLLNSELTAAMVYNKLDQKSVTSWLDLRNKAAHGKYDEYSKEQVEFMYQGVSNFMMRISI